jgi:hypothetical protein
LITIIQDAIWNFNKPYRGLQHLIAACCNPFDSWLGNNAWNDTDALCGPVIWIEDT